MNLKNMLSRMRQQAGFTMIELLIVIAILGILAVAVLSAINPVEQINRGRDTGSRSDAEQLLGGIDRYNAFQGYYPWQSGAADNVTGTGTGYAVAWTEWNLATSLSQHTTDCQVSDLLSAGSADGSCTGAGELKISFFTRIFDPGYNSLFIYHGANASDSTYICFAPKSDAFATEALNRLDTSGNGALETSETGPADYPADAFGNTSDCGAGGICVCLP